MTNEVISTFCQAVSITCQVQSQVTHMTFQVLGIAGVDKMSAQTELTVESSEQDAMMLSLKGFHLMSNNSMTCQVTV